MKYSVIVVFLFLVIAPTTAQAGGLTAGEVLSKTAVKLAGLKSQRYSFRRELDFKSTGFASDMRIDSFLDFRSGDQIIGARFQFVEPNFIFVFNGSEFFLLNRQKKTIVVRKSPKFEDFESLPGFFDSLLTLRNALPKIVSDASVPKTVTTKAINGNRAHVVEFVLDSRILTLSGGFFQTTPRRFTYRLTIDAKSFLPLEVYRTNDVNQDFTRTSFDYTQAAPPQETSWFYSTYLKEYTAEQPREDRLIKTGQTAPAWRLPTLATDEVPVESAQFSNKVVLIEFWISFCGYCIAAVPKLNAVADKFRGRDFALVGINANDSKEIVRKFERNNRPRFPLLYQGAATAEAFGADGFPTIVLLDKSGKVIYAGDFDPAKTSELEAMIERNL